MGSGLTSRFGIKSKSAKAEESRRLCEAESKLEAISRSQAVIEFNLDGTIIHANENFLGAMGYRLDEIKGQHHSLFVDSATRSSDEYAQFWKRLNRGEFFSQEFKRVAKGGKEIWIQASYNPLIGADGKPYGVVKFATDITERKLNDANSSGQLDAIQKSQAVIEFNLDGTVITANDNFLQTLGYQLNEIQGKHHRLFVDSNYANSGEYRDFWERLGRGEYQAGEFKRIDKSGHEVWIQASYNPILDTNGRPFKIVKYASNITDQKQLQKTIESVLDETQVAITAMAAGDLTTTMNGQFTGRYAEFQKSVNDCVDRMRHTMTEIRTVANNVSSDSADIAQGNGNLSQRTVSQAANLEETVASMEEITTTVEGNAENSSRANELAQAAATQAKTGGEIVQKAMNSMQGLNEASNKISDIIGVINDIAFQTNLLALNASVEAARAGEQGRGFAVVASEVRGLAGRSATAAKEIKELIEDSATRVNESSRLVNQSGDSLNEIVAGVENVTVIIGHISEAGQEQSLGIGSVNNAITQIDTLTQQNATLVEQVSSASQNLSSQASELSRLVSSFKLDSDNRAIRQTGLGSGYASNSERMQTAKRAQR